MEDTFQDIAFEGTVFKGFYHDIDDCYLLLVDTAERFDVLFKYIMSSHYVMCDTETNGFRWYDQHRAVGLVFGAGSYNFYIPIRHEDSLLGGPVEQQLSPEYVFPYVQEFFNRNDVCTVWINKKFDEGVFRADNVRINDLAIDAQIDWKLLYEHYNKAALKDVCAGWKDDLGIWNDGLVGPHASQFEDEVDEWRGKEARARRSAYLKLVKEAAKKLESSIEFQGKSVKEMQEWVKEFDPVLSKHPWKDVSKDDIHYGYIPMPLMVKYAAYDAHLTKVVFMHTRPRVLADEGLTKTSIREHRLGKLVLDMEHDGVAISKDRLDKASKDFHEQIVELEDQFAQQIGSSDININSNKQIIEALKNGGVALTKLSKSGKSVSLDDEVITGLAKTVPAMATLKQYRELQKINNTYIEGIRTKLDPKGYLHGTFNLCVRTGRLSCSNPNLTNIPTTKVGSVIKEAFVVPPDDEYIMVFMDYSQIELRATADESEEPNMIDAYVNNMDLHSKTAATIYHMDYHKFKAVIDDENHKDHKEYSRLRKFAKIASFLVIYGGGASNLASSVNIPLDEAKDFIDQYFRVNLQLKRWIIRTQREVGITGIVRNEYGRIRHLPDAIESQARARVAKMTHLDAAKQEWLVKKLVQRAKRQATNVRIQGRCADQFKETLIRLDDLFKSYSKKRSRLINAVHDDAQSYIHREELWLIRKMKERMEDYKWKVPVVADVSWSPVSWGDKTKLEV